MPNKKINGTINNRLRRLHTNTLLFYKKNMFKKSISKICIVALLLTNMFNANAATQIGTWSVSGTWAFDSAIMWDDNLPGTASGSVSNILIKARVNPTLNMEISNSEIDLGVLTPWVTSTGSLFIEIGTNAKDWVTITARSQSGWLTNTDDNSVIINNTTSDWVAESYTFESTPNTTDDSSYAAFSASWLSSTEVNNNTTEHGVYTTNKPEDYNNVDDLEFIVGTTINAQTWAWDYEDRVTFTVTWNF